METAERSPEKWLWPFEVSALFEQAGLYSVPSSTLRDWTKAGVIRALRTPGGRRRYRQSDALALIDQLKAAA